MSAGRSRPYLSMSYRGVRRNSNGRFDIKKRPVLEVEHIGNYIARKRFSQVSIVANIAVVEPPGVHLYTVGTPIDL